MNLTERIKSIDFTNIDDVVPVLDDILAGNEIDDREEFFRCSFELFERFPAADFGLPGSLVHKLEEFYPDYVPLLVESIQRKPTHYTLWMINRILNSQIELELRSELVSLLESVVASSSQNQEIAEEAKRFLSLQKNT